MLFHFATLRRQRQGLCQCTFILILFVSVLCCIRIEGDSLVNPGALASESHAAYSAHTCTFKYRGGADNSEELLKDDEDVEWTNVDDEDRTRRKQSIIHSPLSAPFRLLNEAQEKASMVLEKVEAGHEIEEEHDEESGNSPTLLVGGGAAMVGAKPGKRQMEALDTNRVAPLSSRLLYDAEEESSDSHETEEVEPTSRDMTDVAKLWWVNVWTQQLSDLEVMNETYNVVSDDEGKPASEVEEEEINNIEVGDFDQIEQHQATSEVPLDDAVDISIPEIFQKPGETKVLPEKESLHAKHQSEGVENEREDLSVQVKPSVASKHDSFVSSGLWVPIDNLFTFGLAHVHPSFRISRQLRPVRKFTARITGLHGFMSGKPSRLGGDITEESNEIRRDGLVQRRIEAMGRTQASVEPIDEVEIGPVERRDFFGGRRMDQRSVEGASRVEFSGEESMDSPEQVPETTAVSPEDLMETKRRFERVKEIDRLISEGQTRLQELICEKDVLQERPNPLFNYTIETVDSGRRVEVTPDKKVSVDTCLGIHASRTFKFPPDDLVEEYLDMIFSTRRLTRMNHTYLWKDSDTEEDDDDESIGDDLLTPSADAHRLYRDTELPSSKPKNGRNGKNRNGGGGSWLLRQSIGKGPSLGEKIGEAAETAAYKAVCAAVMSFLARALSSLHGINVMKHSDIRLYLEQAPDLPPLGQGPGSLDNYAQETIKTVIRRKARKNKKRLKSRLSEESFVQRDAVTEMLLSHVQISAPLLKLFPIAWQRALLGNIITLATAVMSDFFDGLQFQLLGHRLSFAFKPITEEDMINYFGLAGNGFNHRRAKPEEFEAAVKATAEDVGEELKFLDRWHERALGSGVLRTQIANLIARIVLTLTDEVLSGARMDLWSAQAGGPRMLAGLEYRTKQMTN